MHYEYSRRLLCVNNVRLHVADPAILAKLYLKRLKDCSPVYSSTLFSLSVSLRGRFVVGVTS